MSSKRSRHGSDNSPEGHRKRSSSPQKSKWESPTEDRRRKTDKRHESSRDRDTRRPREDSHRSREDHSRNRSPDDRRHRRHSRERDDRRRHHESPEHRRKRNESPDHGRRDGSRDRRRDEPERKRRDSPDHSRRERRNDDNSWKNRKTQRKYDDKEYNWGSSNVKNDPDEAPVEKEKPNFELSGALAKQTNSVAGVEVKYAEPPEARKPKRRWRLYQFKGEQSLPVLHIHRQSAYLIGRDRKVCDMPIDHPSASKQHAVLQYRLVKYETEDGRIAKRIRPYIIDLNSSNGTFLNNTKIDPSKYYELMEKDVLKFAFSSREYVLLHERSKDDSDDGGDDDNVVEEDEQQQPKEESTASRSNRNE